MAAMRVFAQKGFEAASLTALTKAMKINRVSMYATFGNKEELFRKAIDLYSRGGAELFAGCLAADTARVGVDRLLRKGVTMFTDPARWGRVLRDSRAANWPRRVRGYSPIRRQETGSDRVGPAGPVRPRHRGRRSCPSPSRPQTSHGSTRWLSRASRFRLSTGGRRSNFSAWWTWRWRVGRCDPASDDKCTGGTSPNPPPQYQEDDDSIDAADWRPA